MKWNKRNLTAFMLALVLLGSTLLFLWPSGTHAEKRYIDFAQSKLSATETADFYVPQKTMNMTFLLNEPGEIKSVKVFMKNEQGQYVQVPSQFDTNTKKLTFTANGVAQTFYGKKMTNPGHHVYRLPNGQRWEHKGERTPAIQFIPDQSTFQNGVTQYPGEIPHPNTGRVLYRESQQPVQSVEMYADLRYEYGVIGQDGLEDKAPNWNMRGAAVTHNYKVEKPGTFYDTEDGINDGQGTMITSDKLDPSSITIFKAQSNPQYVRSIGTEPYYWGASETPGYGEVKVRRMLTGDLIANEHYYLTPDNDGTYGEDRNYYMDIDTYWKGTSYRYSGYVEIEFDTTKANLIAADLNATGALVIQNPETIKATFLNQGKDITTAFDVSVVLGRADSYTKVLATWRFNGMKAGEQKELTFQHVFDSFGAVEMTLMVDMPKNEIEEASEADNVFSRVFQLVPGKPTGDFDIVPSEITYRDPFTLIPKDIEVGPGCTYQYHIFEFINSPPWLTPQQKGMTLQLRFNYGEYPPNLQIGTNWIRMKVVSSCGESDWVTHPLVVNPPTGINRPPVFEAGWFPGNDFIGVNPIHTTVLGSTLNLRIINDPNRTPPIPSDPDGDPISWYWDFAGSPDPWIRSLPQKYGLNPTRDRFTGIVADQEGTFSVEVTGTDPFGASTKRTVMISVVPPNPVAVIGCPKTVKSGKKLADGAIHSRASYSPAGRPIDHSKDVWENKQDVYYNYTGQEIKVTVTLKKVFDDNGLGSKNSDSCEITVLPDPPPVAKLAVPPLGLRNQDITIQNQSYTTDGEPLVDVVYRYKYDRNNNGFSDDSWVTLPDKDLNKIVFRASKVGKYLFYTEVTKSTGSKANTSAQSESTLTLNIVNLAPSVSFGLEGQNDQPVINPPVNYTASTIYNNWPLYKSNTTDTLAPKSKYWSVNGQILQGLTARESHGGMQQYFSPQPQAYDPYLEYYYRMSAVNDNGYGANRLSPYRALTEVDFSGPFMDKYNTITHWNTATNSTNVPKFRASDTHIFLKAKDGAFDVIRAYKISDLGPVSEQFNFNTLKYEYSYDHGNPIAYELSFYNASEHAKPRTFGGQTFYPTVLDFEYADGTLYVIRRTTGIPSGGDGGGGKNDIAVYDPKTGKEIKSTLDTGAYVPGFGSSFDSFSQTLTKNGNLVLRYNRSVYEYNKNLQLVRSYTIPAPSLANPTEFDRVCPGGYYNWETSNLFQDTDGNLYFYDYPVCYGTSIRHGNISFSGLPIPNNTYVTKLTNTFTIGWRRLISTDLNTWTIAGGMPYLVGEQYKDNRRRPFLQINTRNGTLQARSFHVETAGFMHTYTLEINHIRLSDGALLNLYPETSPYFYGDWNMNYHVDWSGNLLSGQGSKTADGYRTHYSSTTQHIEVTDPSGTKRSYTVMAPHRSGNGTKGTLVFAEYLGDGLLVYGYSFYQEGISFGYAKGPATTNPKVTQETNLGQFVSTNSITQDMNYYFTMRLSDTSDQTMRAGFSFRMSDPKNRLAVEADGGKIYLARYVNGTRTVLGSTTYAMASDTDYAFQIKTTGSRVQVFVNSVEVIDVSSVSYPGGKFGPFSERDYTAFTAIRTQADVPLTTEWMTGYAILENGYADVRYQNILYSDPENDPRAGSMRWTYSHTPKFLNNQGLSPLHGQTRTTEVTRFQHVGEYDITLQAIDDPYPDPAYKYPNNTFDNYREMSEPFTRKLIVHRRPVAQFTLSTGSGGIINWNDTSYDPDRYNPGNGTCSPPDTTGYNYCSNRGIFERKYSYVTPSGQVVHEKLVRPDEAGTYLVFLQVRDEYGAWSYPAQQTITSSGGVPQNSKPTVELTYPTGTNANPTFTLLTKPTITWRQNDTPGTVFKGYAVVIRDETGATVLETGEASQNTTSTTASWPVSQDLPRGVKLQVQVKVSDGEQWSDWSNIGWMIINTPPSVTITYPDGYSKENPTMIFDNLRPTIQWRQSDNERNQFNRFQIEIRNASGTIVHSTGIQTQNTTSTTNSYNIPVDLPTLQPLQARMRVTDEDNNLWSEWSNTVWFFIDRTPRATMKVPNGTKTNPTLMGNTPTIQFEQRDDDPGNVFTKYQVQFLNEAGNVVIHDSKEVSQNVAGQVSTVSYTVPEGEPLPSGQKIQVRARTYDGYVWSDWSTATWLKTNRPPLADFDWTPKPVWEGDTVNLINHSTDPDGDKLSASWHIRGPDGRTLSGAGWNMTLVCPLPGEYEVTLTVSDGWSADSKTRSIYAQELTILPEVYHTPEWLVHHQNSGHNVTTVPKDFYSGEIFVTEAISSPAPVSEVKAWIDTTGLNGMPLKAEVFLTPADSPVRFRGELFDERFLSLTEGLPKGLQVIHFQIRYANGVIKQQSVPVNIIANVNAAVQVHRRQ